MCTAMPPTSPSINSHSPVCIREINDFSGQQPGANLYAQRPALVGDSTSTAHAACRTVKSSKNAVACRLDFVASKACEVTSDDSVVIGEEIAPVAIADRGSLLR
jgi:hypothetical protein